MQALGGDAGDLNLGDSKGVLGSQRKLPSLSKTHQFHISWHARHTHAPASPQPSTSLPCASSSCPASVLLPLPLFRTLGYTLVRFCGSEPSSPLLCLPTSSWGHSPRSSVLPRQEPGCLHNLPTLGQAWLLRLSWSLAPAPATRGGPWCVLLCPATTPHLTSSTSHSPVQGADSHAVRSHQPRPAHSPCLLRGPTAGLPACLGSLDAALRVFKADSHHVLIAEEPERGGRGDRSAGLVSGASVSGPLSLPQAVLSSNWEGCAASQGLPQGQPQGV